MTEASIGFYMSCVIFGSCNLALPIWMATGHFFEIYRTDVLCFTRPWSFALDSPALWTGDIVLIDLTLAQWAPRLLMGFDRKGSRLDFWVNLKALERQTPLEGRTVYRIPYIISIYSRFITFVSTLGELIETKCNFLWFFSMLVLK